MKKFVLLFVICLLTPAMAWAFTVPEEVQVVPPTATTQPSTTITVEEMRKAIKAGAVAAAKPYKKVAEKATATAEESVEVAKKSTQALENSTEVLKGNQGLMQELTTSNTTLAGAVTELGKGVGSVAGETAKSVRGDLIWAGAILVLLGIIASIILVVVIRKTGGNISSSVEKKVDAIATSVKNIPNETAGLVKRVEAYAISIPDVRGKSVSFKPEIVDGMYKSLYVPKTVSGEVADPKKIVRVPMTDKGRLYRSTNDVIADYLDGAFDGDDPHSVQQKKIIEHLKDAGILVIG